MVLHNGVAYKLEAVNYQLHRTQRNFITDYVALYTLTLNPNADPNHGASSEERTFGIVCGYRDEIQGDEGNVPV